MGGREPSGDGRKRAVFVLNDVIETLAPGALQCVADALDGAGHAAVLLGADSERFDADHVVGDAVEVED